MEKAWHHLSIEKVFKELNSGIRGLSEQEAEKRLKKYGYNKIPEKKSFSKIKIFIEQLKSPLVYILLIAGIVTFFLEEYSDSIIIFIAVFLNTIIGYIQEKKASDALNQLKKILQLSAIVFRNGQEKKVLQKEIIPGDIIFLRAGDKIPADSRIVESHNLKINESSLTGEWLASSKNEKVLRKEVPLADRQNMAYMGTIVESGWGKAVIIQTGLKTEIGKIVETVKQTKEEKTPYQKKLARFSKVIGGIVIVISTIIFIEGMLAGEKFVEIFTLSVAISVAAIPEGLPVAMTAVLALGMQRILKRKGLVRRMASAETLGSTSIILTDKTGTLTEAKMEVAGIFTETSEILKEDISKKNIDKNGTTSNVKALKIGMFCNESFIESSKIIHGRPTEKALFSTGIKVGFSRKELEEEHPVIDQLLFDSNCKYAISLNKLNLEKNILYMVGSPEKILSMSSFLDIDGQKRKMLLADIKRLKIKYEKLTRNGFRVVSVAYRETDDQKIDNKREEKIKEMVYVGFFALHDPIRKKTKEIMETCRKAGMKPIIVTGDHMLTAKAVAEKLGFKTNKENLMEGSYLSKLSDLEFEKVFKNIQVYSRVEPIQKLRIVKAWQKAGNVVAMTGDGINDTPAIKQADIGVALGSGTDIAKEVSDLILLTDNFSVIKSAIEEGRAIIDNIRKIITYLLSDSFSEVILISMSLLFGWPLPILAAQILWVNLIEDGPLSICLAFEKKEKDIIKRKPLDYDCSLLNKEMKVLILIIGIITDVLLLGLFFFLLKYSRYEITHIRSIIFAGLTIDSLFYVFSCKSLRQNLWNINIFSNKFLIYAWISGVVMLLSALYVPFLQGLLKTSGLSLFDWGLVFGLGLLNIILIEFTKWLFIRKEK
ncbi:MAG: HAD-IC family P-type ATPase [Patescibacteria group bacterium]